MRYVKRRADCSTRAYRDHYTWTKDGGWLDQQTGHAVYADKARGVFRVLSGHSGRIYEVNTDGECQCEAFKNRLWCSHQGAVLRHARVALEIAALAK